MTANECIDELLRILVQFLKFQHTVTPQSVQSYDFRYLSTNVLIATTESIVQSIYVISNITAYMADIITTTILRHWKLKKPLNDYS